MIEIRPHRISDIPYRVIWLNNPNVNQYIGQCLDQKTTFAKQKVWFNKYLKDKNKKFFTMSYGKIPIGFMGLSRIDKTNRNADVFIAIGDDKYRGKGFGEIAMQYLIKFGFKKLGLHKISLGVFEKNKPAINLYKKLGFVIEGTLKDDVFFAGEYHNQILMAIFNKKVAIKTKK
ncbi:MAG: hypothetical protein A3J93_02740 [Candidatus Magasanikbacteria bacterium RIFOXYC2_FULL_42_28]|uniref:N-acetyltransferase domain-containing protein n=1 Tax=Candidatus Magasanikbacteria bacterium RIFOXYC2_FULL_42_28 TaxID=1798704 RepID=A0A1F6NWH2_9BACT|nr:MAG: hypothetical protein A3J93_02740 [Candidatus Magasanikbacteria bacterium RIFOXYC2_FULL_42_28]